MNEELERRIEHLRKEYLMKELDESTVDPNPIRQFSVWFDEAMAANVEEPNAMTLATTDASCRPTARVVLLKSFNNNGFVFYTNYHSRKGREMLKNPYAALCFLWLGLERQVRIDGKIEKVSRVESEEYFASRPRGSQIGAWVSQQSEVVNNRHVLEKALKEAEEKFGSGPVPMPHNWGGYLLVPDSIEFWQGRASRLHDRIHYRLHENKWIIERLSP